MVSKSDIEQCRRPLPRCAITQGSSSSPASCCTPVPRRSRSATAFGHTRSAACGPEAARAMTESGRGERPVDPGRMMILSLKPQYAEGILSGSKPVELRRVGPKISVPTRALIYATTPVKALLGACAVGRVVTDRLTVLWGSYGSRTGLRQGEFWDYFMGLEVGSALVLSHARRFSSQIPLADLRASRCLGRPPQSYSYIDAAIGDQLLRLAVRCSSDRPEVVGF